MSIKTKLSTGVSPTAAIDQFIRTCTELNGYLSGFVEEHPKRPGLQELFPRFERELLEILRLKQGGTQS